MHAQPERVWPRRAAVVVVRRYDSHAVWTWMAVAGLAAASLLAVVGMPAVDMHGPLHYLGVMDPLCGATRSVYLTLHGRVGDAMRFNPAGPVFVIGAFLTLGRAAMGHATRAWVHVHLPRRLWGAVAVAAVLALEINQQSHAALLISPWSSV